MLENPAWEFIRISCIEVPVFFTIQNVCPMRHVEKTLTGTPQLNTELFNEIADVLYDKYVFLASLPKRAILVRWNKVD